MQRQFNVCICRKRVNRICIIGGGIKAFDTIKVCFDKQTYLCKVGARAYSPAGCARARAPARRTAAAATLIVPRLVPHLTIMSIASTAHIMTDNH